MKLSIFLLCASALSVAACKKSKHDSGQLSGLYTEVTPVAGNTTLHFISGGRMVRGESGSSFKDTSLVTFPENKIRLRSQRGEYPDITLDFMIIDGNTIKIEYFGPMIPESPKSYMVLRK
ncbi:hypothetical protein [Pseudoflavitalea rhizosphaerae]|uniref:hypothetical protein n=1 Tax=Pseudoflavitalea rhizosphaerae TaxID=1884793 RepID=UPI000F8EDD45|nr:hypothetical protein [Pseudoflavitalea rhizosphaerae]